MKKYYTQKELLNLAKGRTLFDDSCGRISRFFKSYNDSLVSMRDYDYTDNGELRKIGESKLTNNEFERLLEINGVI